MSLDDKDLYYVAVKLFLERDGKLLITKDIYNDGWDLPGGRIRKDEFGAPLEKVIERKIREELGAEVTYTLGAPVVFFRHERIEETDNVPVRIFGIGYEARFDGGEICLGEHHAEFTWVDIGTFDPESYFTGGWKVGVKAYLDKKRSQ